jgi:hypothetical protein
MTYTTEQFAKTYSCYNDISGHYVNATYYYSDSSSSSKPEFEQKTVKEIPKSEDDFWKKDFEKAYK